jgi:hypothetical protein
LFFIVLHCFAAGCSPAISPPVRFRAAKTEENS